MSFKTNFASLFTISLYLPALLDFVSDLDKLWAGLKIGKPDLGPVGEDVYPFLPSWIKERTTLSEFTALLHDFSLALTKTPKPVV